MSEDIESKVFETWSVRHLVDLVSKIAGTPEFFNGRSIDLFSWTWKVGERQVYAELHARTGVLDFSCTENEEDAGPTKHFPSCMELPDEAMQSIARACAEWLMGIPMDAERCAVVVRPDDVNSQEPGLRGSVQVPIASFEILTQSGFVNDNDRCEFMLIAPHVVEIAMGPATPSSYKRDKVPYGTTHVRCFLKLEEDPGEKK